MPLSTHAKHLVGKMLRLAGLPKIGFMQQSSDYARYKIGVKSYGRPKILDWGEGSTLQVGSYCSVGSKVTIFLGGDHRTDWVSTYPFNVVYESASHIKGHPRSKGNVIVGNDVWIGYGATLMSGVTIGNGAVVGAYSMVTRSVEPYSIVAGSPAQHKKFRFAPNVIADLQSAAWWDLPEAEVEKLAPLLQSADAQALIIAVAEVRGRLAVGNLAARPAS